MEVRSEIAEKYLEQSEEQDKFVLNLGPSHPAMHGILRNVVELDGERIMKVYPEIGFCHRSFEKLAESYTYNQVITITDRMNYVSSPMNNVAWVLAVEKMMGIEVPKKVAYVRVIFMELSRIMDHLVSMGILGVDLGAYTGFLYFFEQREKIYRVLENMTGARLTTTFGRIGGLERDIPRSFKKDVEDFLNGFQKILADFHKLLTRNRIFMDRTRGVSKITPERALSYGFTGPNLRATGYEWDVRKVYPYSLYEEFDFDIPIGADGDVYDRYLVRMEEMNQSWKIVKQAIENLPEGPYHADIPKVVLPLKRDVYSNMEAMITHFKIIMHGIEPPVGEFYSSVESPNGELGVYIVSDGTANPYRVHWRRPCFYFYNAICELIEGGLIADAVACISSINVIAGELDC